MATRSHHRNPDIAEIKKWVSSYLIRSQMNNNCITSSTMERVISVKIVKALPVACEEMINRVC